MGQCAVILIYKNKKYNTRSCTEAELVATYDAMMMILWTKLFFNTKLFEVKENTIMKDNKSEEILEKNGKRGSRNKTINLNIRYFFIAYQIDKYNLKVKHFSIKDMGEYFMTKPISVQDYRFRGKYEHWSQ